MIVMLTAKNSKGVTVIAFEVEKKVDTFYCPMCNAELILKKGEVVIHHFAHKSKSDCKFGGESIAHYEMKLAIYQYYKNNTPFEVKLEQIIIDDKGEKHITDVLVIDGDKEYCYELQHSPMNFEEYNNRTLGMLNKKDEVIWIFDYDTYFGERDLRYINNFHNCIYRAPKLFLGLYAKNIPIILYKRLSNDLFLLNLKQIFGKKYFHNFKLIPIPFNSLQRLDTKTASLSASNLNNNSFNINFHEMELQKIEGIELSEHEIEEIKNEIKKETEKIRDEVEKELEKKIELKREEYLSIRETTKRRMKSVTMKSKEIQIRYKIDVEIAEEIDKEIAERRKEIENEVRKEIENEVRNKIRWGKMHELQRKLKKEMYEELKHTFKLSENEIEFVKDKVIDEITLRLKYEVNYKLKRKLEGELIDKINIEVSKVLKKYKQDFQWQYPISL